MGKVAILVDAGYVWHHGVTAWAGEPLHRDKIDLRPSHMAHLLKRVAVEASAGATVLRIYWYDGVPIGGLTPMQNFIAMAKDVKLRPGTLVPRRRGGMRQKGVDTLIVAEMIDLARNGAVSDVVLLSGDEDVRVGVQLAQNAGVRVHLLGIVPAALSQSRRLRQEADTLMELSKCDLDEFLYLVPEGVPNMSGALPSSQELGFREVIEDAVKRLLASQPNETWQTVHGLQEQEFMVPWVSARLIVAVAERAGRKLNPDEGAYARRIFRCELAKRVDQQQP